MKQKQDGVNLNDLYKLAKQKPQYTKLFLGLTKIDATIKAFVRDILEDTYHGGSEVDFYYVETTLLGQCYNLFLYHSMKQVKVGYTWPMADFLKKCQNKGEMELQLNTIVKQMVLTVEDETIKNPKKIHWIQPNIL